MASFHSIQLCLYSGQCLPDAVQHSWIAKHPWWVSFKELVVFPKEKEHSRLRRFQIRMTIVINQLTRSGNPHIFMRMSRERNFRKNNDYRIFINKCLVIFYLLKWLEVKYFFDGKCQLKSFGKIKEIWWVLTQIQ